MRFKPKTRTENAPAEIFRWKDQFDVYKTPQEMNTHHLFYTFKYRSEAVKHIYRELKTRRDMEPAWIKTLVHIRKCIEGSKVTGFQLIGNSVSEEDEA